MANIATWADSVRYSKWGRFTKTFHFIDAKDDPPLRCDVDLARDCKDTGCVVTSLANYTLQSLDPELSFRERNIAAKFVIHFVGDLHQPLHNEDVARGGNGIHVRWRGSEVNLHRVWDSSIAEMLVNGGRRGKPFEVARRWAGELAAEIEGGKWAGEREAWLKDIDLEDAEGTAMAWSRECNAYVCSHGMSPAPFPFPSLPGLEGAGGRVGCADVCHSSTRGPRGHRRPGAVGRVLRARGSRRGAARR